ncbi:MAG: FadR/GntR family transcriptional regulator [Solirubrobacteraceae bacterium]
MAAREESAREAPGVLPAAVPARRKGLPEEVADQLIRLIASGHTEEVRLPPERQLCDDLAVSRNVLREALSALTRMGVIDTRGKTRFGRTARARALQLGRAPSQPPSRDPLLDPIEVRRILEPEVAAIATERATAAALEEIRRCVELMAEGIEAGQNVVEYDSAFHSAIARATDNLIVMELVAGLAESLRHSREVSFRPREASTEALADHQAILDAMERRDPAAAREAMTAHLNHVADLLRAGVRGA